MNSLLNALRRLHDELGVMGLTSLSIIGAGMLFLATMLTPLESRNRDIERQLAASAQPGTASGALRAPTPSARLAAFYQFLGNNRRTTDWLARLDAAGQSAGVELQSADYRLEKTTGTPIERYEIRLPLRGRYAQIRSFIDGALAEIPVLSLDEVKFKRERASDAQIEAELRLTLHVLDSGR
jgi:hypothetical protein